MRDIGKLTAGLAVAGKILMPAEPSAHELTLIAQVGQPIAYEAEKCRIHASWLRKVADEKAGDKSPINRVYIERQPAERSLDYLTCVVSELNQGNYSATLYKETDHLNKGRETYIISVTRKSALSEKK